MLLPSEKARLVLGYLIEEGPQEAYKHFLAQSKHLREFRSLIRNNENPNIHHPTFRKLSVVLDEYYQINSLVNSIDVRVERFNKVTDCKSLLQKVEIILNVAKTNNSESSKCLKDILPDPFLKPSNHRKTDRITEKVDKDCIKSNIVPDLDATDQNLPVQKRFLNSTAYDDLPDESVFSDNSTGTFNIGNYSPPEKKLYSAKYNSRTVRKKKFRRPSQPQNLYKERIKEDEVFQISSDENDANFEMEKNNEEVTYNVLRNTLLEHPDMHTQIAETINKTILNKNNLGNTDKAILTDNSNCIKISDKNNLSSEGNRAIDQAQIDLILAELEKIPEYDKVVDDIFGSQDQSGNNLRNTFVPADNNTETSENSPNRLGESKCSSDDSELSAPLRDRLRSRQRNLSTVKEVKKNVKNKVIKLRCNKRNSIGVTTSKPKTPCAKSNNLQEVIQKKISAKNLFEQNPSSHTSSKTDSGLTLLTFNDANDSAKKNVESKSLDGKEQKDKIIILSDELIKSPLPKYIPSSNPTPASECIIGPCASVGSDSNMIISYTVIPASQHGISAYGTENVNPEPGGETDITNMSVYVLQSSQVTGTWPNSVKENNQIPIPGYMPKTDEPLRSTVNQTKYKRILPKPPQPTVTLSRMDTIHGNVIINSLPQIPTPPVQVSSAFVPISDINIQYSTAEATKEKSTIDVSDTNMNEMKNNITPTVSMASNSRGQSMSTPRRTSHVRALDFNSPSKVVLCPKANSSSKTGNARRNLNTAKNGNVFASLNNQSAASNNLLLPVNSIQENESDSTLNRCEGLNQMTIPIATRSPLPVLKGEWGRVNGLGVIFGDTESPIKKIDSSQDNHINFDNTGATTIIENQKTESNISATPRVSIRSENINEVQLRTSAEEKDSDIFNISTCDENTDSKKKSQVIKKAKSENQSSLTTNNLIANDKGVEQWHKQRNVPIVKKSWDSDLRRNVANPNETVKNIKRTRKRKGKIGGNKAVGRKTLKKRAVSKAADSTQLNSSLDDTMEQGQQIEEALNSSNTENITPERNRTTLSADLNLSHNDETSDTTNPNIIIYDVPKTNPKYAIVNSQIIIADDDTTAESNVIKTAKEPKKSPSSSRKVLTEQKTKTVLPATKKLQKPFTKDNCDKSAEINSRKEIIMGDEEGENSKTAVAADDKSKDNIKKLVNELDNENNKNSIQNNDAEINIAIKSNHDVAVNDSNIESEKSSGTEISIKADGMQSEISPEMKSSLSEKLLINKNVSFTLETPYKYDPKSFPVTPRFVMMDQTQETPLTKLIKTHADQTSLMKCGIPTPDFPVTPKIVVTPKHLEAQSGNKSPSGYANRATDYSSCSSYYKPDESEDINLKMDVIFNADNKNSGATNEVFVSKDLPKEKLLTTNDLSAVKSDEDSTEVNDKTLSFNESSPTKSISSDSDTDTTDSSSCSNSSADDSDSSDSSTSDSSDSKSSPNSKSGQSNENNSLTHNEKKVSPRKESNAERLRTPKKKDELKSQATTIISTKIDTKELQNCENEKVEQTNAEKPQKQHLFADNKNNEITNAEEKESKNAKIPYTMRNREKDKRSDINEIFQSKKTIQTKIVQSTLLKKDNIIQPEEVKKGMTGTTENYTDLLQGTEDAIVDGKLSDILEAKRTRTINKLKSMNTTSKGQKKTTKKEPLKITINKINPGEKNTEGKLADKIRGISRKIEESGQKAEVGEGSKAKVLKSNSQGCSNLQQGSNRRKSLTPRKAVKRILPSLNSSNETSDDIAKNVNDQQILERNENNLQDIDKLESKPLDTTKKEESVSRTTASNLLVPEIANKLHFADSRGSDGYRSLHLSSEDDVVESDIDLNSNASMKQLKEKTANKFQEHLINTGFDIEHANKIETALNKSPLEEGEIDEEDSNDANFTNKLNTAGKLTNLNAVSERLLHSLDLHSCDAIKKNNNLKNTSHTDNKNNSNMNSNKLHVEEAIFNFKETNVTNTAFLKYTVSPQNVKGDGSVESTNSEVNEKQNENLDQSKTNSTSNDSQDSDDEDDDVDFNIRDTFAENIINIMESESFVKNPLSSEDDGFDLNLYKVNAPTEDGDIRVITATQLITLMDIEPEEKIGTIRKDIKIRKKTPLNKLLDELNDKIVESTPANNRKATIVTSTPLANLYESSPKNKTYKHPTHEPRNGAHFKYTKDEKHKDNVEKIDSDDAETNKLSTDGRKEQIKTSSLKGTTNIKGKIQRRTSIDRRAKNVTKKDATKPELIKNSEETSVNNSENIATNAISRVDVLSPQAAKRPRGRPRIKPLPKIPPKRISKAMASSETKETTTDAAGVILNESDSLPNKRKANDDAFYSPMNKKAKTNAQEFLKKQGLDSILDMLHGPAK